MENIVLEGKLFKVLDAQTGVSTRGDWKKQDFVIETTEQYPKKVCITCWGEKVDELQKLKVNDSIKVSVNIESREYNSRWYTDIKAWRFETAASAAPVPPTINNATKSDSDDVLGMSFSEEDDTLPF